MNIYIYGNQSFKKEIHQTLDHANIKFKLDSNSIIKNIDNLDELKETIQTNPNDIYLIDDEKIIKKNSLNQKIKFLTPKDGIEQEFLLDNNIADLSVDSLSEIPKYILKKYEQEKSLDSNIQESIIDIVDEAYENNLELDDELSGLLASDEEDEDLDKVSSLDLEEINEHKNSNDLNKDINLDKIEELISDIDAKEEITDDEFGSLMNFDEDLGLNNVSFDYDDKDLVEDKNNLLNEEKEIEEIEDIDLNEFESLNELDDLDLDENFLETSTDEDEVKDLFDNMEIKTMDEDKGVAMNDEFSELDSLNEDDILNALDGFEMKNDNEPASTSIEPKVEKEKQSMNVSSSNVDDIAQLISKLLNNKTLEITIKIKD